MKINKGKNARRESDDDAEDSDDLDRMRKKYKKAKAREEGGGEEDKSRLTLAEGSNPTRFLPRKGTREFYFEAWIHYNVGPTSQRIRCPGTFNEKGYIQANTTCPICKRFLVEQQRVNTKYKRGSDDGKAAYFKIKDAYHPRQRYFSNVLTASGDVKTLEYGEQIHSQLLEHWFEDGSKVGDFTDVTDGRWMNVKRKGKPGDKKTSYKVIPDDETAELDDWKKLRKKLHDLDAVAGELMAPKDIKAIMEGDFDEDEDEDSSSEDESEEDDDENDEEETPRRKKSKAKRSRDDESDDDDDDDDASDEDTDSISDDDEDEEDEESEEEDESDDEEDEDDDDVDDEPVRSKKKKKQRR